MTQHRVRSVALVAVVLWLAACTTAPRGERYGSWSYVQTRLDPFWWAATEIIDLDRARIIAGTGSGATVAIVGTGVLAGHEDLETVVPGEATCGPPADTGDRNGHGTQLAGLVAGRDPGVFKVTRGMAPGAALIPIKADCGALSAEALTKGIDAAIARKPHVILLAIGGYPGGAPDVQTFLLSRVTSNRDILFVIASVWDGTYYAFPAWTRVDNVLVVAAMTVDADPKDIRKVSTKEIPYSSRRGDIWAPGREIGTADIAPAPFFLGHQQYLMHGTSPAAAIVAGCAALVTTKTGRTGPELKKALLAGAPGNSDLGPAPNGRLNCAKALP